jgi:hypothetical protein
MKHAIITTVSPPNADWVVTISGEAAPILADVRKIRPTRPIGHAAK